MAVERYREAFVKQIKKWIGKNESDGSFKSIIDLYNSHKPLPRNYKVKYTDEWCATTVSAAAIAIGYDDIIPIECSCGNMLEKAKELKVWQEKDNYKPKKGDIILYDWQDTGVGDCTGWPDHVGVVSTDAKGDTFKVIEGNNNGAVRERSVKVGQRYIRGFICPKYTDDKAPAEKKVKEPAKKAVTKKQTNKDKTVNPSKEPKYTGIVTADALNVRTWAGTNNPNIGIYPVIKKGQEIEVCDIVKSSDGIEWAYVRINKKVYGFCSKKYIKETKCED